MNNSKADLENKFNSVKENLAVREAELDELRKNNTEQESIFKQTLVEVKSGYQEAVGHLETVLEEKERANAALDTRVQHQEGQFSILKIKEEEVRSLQVKTGQENRELKQKLEDTESALNETKTEKITLKGKFDELEITATTLEQEFANLKILESELNLEKESLEDNLKSALKDLHETSSKLRSLEETHSKKVNHLTTSLKKITGLEGEVLSLETKLEEMTTERNLHYEKLSMTEEELQHTVSINKTLTHELGEFKEGKEKNLEIIEAHKATISELTSKLMGVGREKDDLQKEKDREQKVQWDETSRLIAERDSEISSLKEERVKLKTNGDQQEQHLNDFRTQMEKEIASVNKEISKKDDEINKLKQTVDKTGLMHVNEKEQFEKKIREFQRAENHLESELKISEDHIVRFERHVDELQERIDSLQSESKKQQEEANAALAAKVSEIKALNHERDQLASELEVKITEVNCMIEKTKELTEGFEEQLKTKEEESNAKHESTEKAFESVQKELLAKNELKDEDCERLQSELRTSKEYNTTLLEQMESDALTYKNAIENVRKNTLLNEASKAEKIISDLQSNFAKELEDKIKSLSDEFNETIIPNKLMEEQRKHLLEVQRMEEDFNSKFEKLNEENKQVIYRRLSVTRRLGKSFRKNDLETKLMDATKDFEERQRKLKLEMDQALFERDELKHHLEAQNDMIAHQKEMLKTITLLHDEAVMQFEKTCQKNELINEYIQVQQNVFDHAISENEGSSNFELSMHEKSESSYVITPIDVRLKDGYFNLLEDARIEMLEGVSRVDKMAIPVGSNERESFLSLTHDELHDQHAALLIEATELESHLAKNVEENKSQNQRNADTLVLTDGYELQQSENNVADILSTVSSYKDNLGRFKKRHYALSALSKQKYFEQVENLKRDHDVALLEAKNAHDIEKAQIKSGATETLEGAILEKDKLFQEKEEIYEEKMKQLKIQHHADVRKLNDELATANIVKKREIQKVTEEHAKTIESITLSYESTVNKLNDDLQAAQNDMFEQQTLLERSGKDSLDEQAKSYGKIIGAMNAKLQHEAETKRLLKQGHKDALINQEAQIGNLKERHVFEIEEVEKKHQDARLELKEKIKNALQEKRTILEEKNILRNTIIELDLKVKKTQQSLMEWQTKSQKNEELNSKANEMYENAKTQIDNCFKKEQTLKVEHGNYVRTLKEEINKLVVEREQARSDINNLKDELHNMEIESSKTKHRLETEKTTLGMHLHGQLEAKEVHAKRQTQLIEQLQTEIADKDDHSKSLAQLTSERMERERKRQEDLQKHTEDQKKLNREKLQEFKRIHEEEKLSLIRKHEEVTQEIHDEHRKAREALKEENQRLVEGKEVAYAKNLALVKGEIEKNKTHAKELVETYSANASSREKEIIERLNANFNVEREGFEKQLGDASHRYEELDKELGFAKLELRKTSKSLDESEAGKFETQQALARMEVQKHGLEEELNQREKDIENLRRSIEQLKQKFTVEIEKMCREHEVFVKEESKEGKRMLDEQRISFSKAIAENQDTIAGLTEDKVLLEQDHANAKGKIEEMKLVKTKLAAQLEALHDTAGENSSTISKLRAELSVLGKELDEERLKVEGFKSKFFGEIEDLKNAKRCQEVLLQTQKSDHEKATEAKDRELTKKLNDAIAEHKTVENAVILQLEEFKHSHKLEMEKAQAKLAVLEDEMEKKVIAAKQLHDKLDSNFKEQLTSNKQHHKDEIEGVQKGLNAEIFQLKETIEKLKSKHSSEGMMARSKMEKDIHSIKIEYQERIDQHEKLFKDELNGLETKYKGDLKILHEKLSASQARSRQLIRKGADAQSEHTEKLEELEAEREKQRVISNDELKKVKREMENCHSKLKLTSERVVKLSNELEQMQQTASEESVEKNTKIHELSDEVRSLNNKLNVVKSKYLESKAVQENLSDTVAEQSITIDKLNKEKAGLQRNFETKATQLREREKSTRQQYLHLQKDSEKLYKTKQESYEKLEDRLNNLKVAHTANKVRLKEKLNKEVELSKEVNHLNKEVASLRGKMETLERTAEEKDVKISSLMLKNNQLEIESKNTINSTSAILEESQIKAQSAMSEYNEREKALTESLQQKLSERTQETGERLKKVEEEHKRMMQEHIEGHRNHIETLKLKFESTVKGLGAKHEEEASANGQKLSALQSQLQKEEESNDKLREESRASRKIIVRLKSKLEEQKRAHSAELEERVRFLHEEHTSAMTHLFSQNKEEQHLGMREVRNEHSKNTIELQQEVEQIRLEAEAKLLSAHDEHAARVAILQDDCAQEIEKVRNKWDDDRGERERTFNKQLERCREDAEHTLSALRSDHEHVLTVQKNLAEQRLLALERKKDQAMDEQKKMLEVRHRKELAAAAAAHVLDQQRGESRTQDEFSEAIRTVQDELHAVEDENNSYKQKIIMIESNAKDLEKKLESKEEEISEARQLRELVEDQKKKAESLVERFQKGAKELKLEIIGLKAKMEARDLQLEQFRKAEAAKEAKYDAQYAASKQRLETMHKKRSEEQRIEFGKLMKKQIDRIQAEKAAWKDDFETQMVSQMKTATSEYIAVNEGKTKELQDYADKLLKENSMLSEKQRILEEKNLSLLKESQSIKTATRNLKTRSETDHQRMIAEKDEAIEQLLLQLKEHNNLLQEMHVNLQNEEREKERLSKEIRRLQRLLFNAGVKTGSRFAETKTDISSRLLSQQATSHHPGWV
eukprot:g1010.t1